MIEVCAKNINAVWFGVACAEQRVFGTSFGDTQQKVLGSLLGNLPFNVPFQVFIEPSDFAKNIFYSLENMFNAKAEKTSFVFVTNHLRAYTKRVLKATMKIPIGYVTSYGSIAKTVGGGPRAVGNVMANNPFAPLVPCHRVVKSDFSLGGYGGGLKVKYQFLVREKQGFSSSKNVSVDGGEMQVFPAEFALRKINYLPFFK
jgi:O-6-methylguanine DNA methyltransferase